MVKFLHHLKAFWLLLLGTWIGMEVAVDFIAAPALFINLKDNTVLAAALAGKLFLAQNISGMIIMTILLAVAATMRRDPMFWKVPAILLLICLTFLLVELLWIMPQIHELRSQLGAMYGSTSQAPADDPLRARFDMLHQASVARAMVQLCLGTTAFLIAAKRKAS
ncbi:DUF4149 domain-containing protein [Candidatus Sumerlaeota bacterium]|nr:DUF4149 domain-containing protein [Candidatus Sumerlaeota bacterium]